MGKTKLKFKIDGFEAIRRSPEAVALLEEKTEAWLNAAGGEERGYAAGVVQGEGRGTLGRAIGTVSTRNFDGQLDNARNHTLLRVMAGGEMVIYTRKDGTKRLATKAQAENWSRKR